MKPKKRLFRGHRTFRAPLTIRELLQFIYLLSVDSSVSIFYYFGVKFLKQKIELRMTVYIIKDVNGHRDNHVQKNHFSHV